MHDRFVTLMHVAGNTFYLCLSNVHVFIIVSSKTREMMMLSMMGSTNATRMQIGFISSLLTSLVLFFFLGEKLPLKINPSACVLKLDFGDYIYLN